MKGKVGFVLTLSKSYDKNCKNRAPTPTLAGTESPQTPLYKSYEIIPIFSHKNVPYDLKLVQWGKW